MPDRPSRAGDDRFGFSTHFEQGWPSGPVMPAISASGAGYIRDDLFAGSWEPTQGTFIVPIWDSGWLKAAASNGLKVVGILGPNGHLLDPYDPTDMTNRAVFIAKTGLVSALEITNEPNNDYQSKEGSTWEVKLKALTSQVASAVHAAVPNVQVIGLGAQGQQIVNMLPGTIVDGVVYHPYGQNNSIPDSVYEPPWFNYVLWGKELRSVTALPAWETEWGTQTSPTYSGDNQADYISRRLLSAAGLGVEHTFIYEFKDNGEELFGVESSNPMVPKPSYGVVQQIIASLAGVTGAPASPVKIYNLANSDTTDATAYAYQGATKTVIAYWFANHSPVTPPPSSTVSLSYVVPNPHGNSILLDPFTGISVPLTNYKRYSSGTQFSVAGLPISDHPLIIIMQ